MHEKPRFGIALAGVGGCLCIAAGIVVTAPRESAIPSVHGLPAARAERLPRLPMPSWSDVATHVASSAPARPWAGVQETPSSDAQSHMRVDAPRAEAVTAAPAVLNRQSSPRQGSGTPSSFEGAIVNLQSRVPLMLSNAPHASGTDVVVAGDNGARERGAVTGALVTASVHIGGGFRTVGRTLKRVF
jgi:hypothetical protein